MTPSTGPAAYYDHRVYNFPANGRIRFIDRKVNRQIQRRRAEIGPKEEERRGILGFLFGRNN